MTTQVTKGLYNKTDQRLNMFEIEDHLDASLVARIREQAKSAVRFFRECIQGRIQMTLDVKRSCGRCPQKTVTTTRLRLSQGILALFGIFSTYLEVNNFTSAREINGVTVRDFPDVVYFVAHGVLAATTLGLGITIFCCSPDKPKIALPPENNFGTKLVSSQDVRSRGVDSYIHQLCEIDTEGNPTPCDIEEIHSIIAALKNNHALDTLNTIPRYFISASHHLDEPQPLYTPLQYWAAKGNLQAVSLLFRHGAVDHCLACSEVVAKTTSALYEAAIHGHRDVTSFLLQSEACVDDPFAQIVLFSFIPNFVFDICNSQQINDDTLTCLGLILLNLQKKDRGNLAFQLQIPIDKQENLPGENCIDYLLDKKPEQYLKAVDLLKSFGCQTGVVLTLEDLRSGKHYTGTGFTLGELARMK